jgi:hypothetical protein
MRDLGSAGLLMGAVYDGTTTYYLATKSGIYKIADPPTATANPLTQVVSGDFLGIITDGTDIYAVTPDTVYRGSAGSFNKVSGGGTFSGGMALWTRPPTTSPQLLLLGLIRGSGTYSYGYREFILASNQLYTPGSSLLSSIKSGDTYASTLGKHAVNSIICAPAGTRINANGKPVVFAGTVKDGLFSYRDRGGSAQWNGENNSY